MFSFHSQGLVMRANASLWHSTQTDDLVTSKSHSFHQPICQSSIHLDYDNAKWISDQNAAHFPFSTDMIHFEKRARHHLLPTRPTNDNEMQWTLLYDFFFPFRSLYEEKNFSTARLGSTKKNPRRGSTVAANKFRFSKHMSFTFSTFFLFRFLREDEGTGFTNGREEDVTGEIFIDFSPSRVFDFPEKETRRLQFLAFQSEKFDPLTCLPSWIAA